MWPLPLCPLPRSPLEPSSLHTSNAKRWRLFSHHGGPRLHSRLAVRLRPSPSSVMQIWFSRLFLAGVGDEVTHFVLFTSSTSNNQLCLLKCLFELILLPPADRELTGRMPASPTASSSSVGFSPSALSSWFPEPWEACLPGPAVSAAPPLCALCVLHKGRPGAPRRQGSCSPVSVPCTAGLGDSINVCCTYIRIIKKVNSCCRPR